MILINSKPGVTLDMVKRRRVRMVRSGQYLWSDLDASGNLLRNGRCYGSELPKAVKEAADAQTAWPGYVDWPLGDAK